MLIIVKISKFGNKMGIKKMLIIIRAGIINWINFLRIRIKLINKKIELN
jgi:hypothetical protein